MQKPLVVWSFNVEIKPEEVLYRICNTNFAKKNLNCFSIVARFFFNAQCHACVIWYHGKHVD